MLILILGIGGGGAYFISVPAEKRPLPAPRQRRPPPFQGPSFVSNPITTLADGHVVKVGLSLRMAAKPKDKKLASIVSGLLLDGLRLRSSISWHFPAPQR